MKNLLYLPLLAAMFVLFGCSTEPEGLDQPQSPEQIIDPETRSTIEAMGYSTEDIYVTDDAYWVEGDIIIPKEHVEEQKNEPQTRQTYWGNSYLVSRTQIKDITIGIDIGDQLVSNQMNNVIDAAIAEFNNLPNCAVKLRKVSGGGDITLTISFGVFDYNSVTHPSMICAAEIPYRGDLGRYIHINNVGGVNPGWTWVKISSTKVKTALIHAIGHCLGLAHTDSNSAPWPYETIGELNMDVEDIDNTPYTDKSSIMNLSEHNYDNTVTTLSDGDKLALSILYPKYELRISGNVSVTVGESCYYEIIDSSGDLPSSATVTWTITGGTKVSESGRTVLVKINSGTKHEIAATVKVGTETYTVPTLKLIASVNPLIGGTIAPATQTIAYGATPAIFTSTANASGGEGTITYQWQKSSNKTSWTNITNAKSTTYQSSALTSTTYFRRQATDGKTTLYSNIVTVNVAPILLGGTIAPETQFVEYGSIPSLLTSSTSASGGSGQITYQWVKHFFEDWWIDVPYATSINYQSPIIDSHIYPGAVYIRRAIDGVNSIAYSNMVGIGSLIWDVSLLPAPKIKRDKSHFITSKPGQKLTFEVENPGKNTYIWEMNGKRILGESNGPIITTTIIFDDNIHSIPKRLLKACAIRCKIQGPNDTRWSDPIIIQGL